MLNRATQSFTAPGSTYKPCTTIAGMDTGIISSGTTFYCSGSFDKVTPSPKCWRLSGHGGEVAATAIRDSCNVFFYNVGYILRAVRMAIITVLTEQLYYRNTQTFWVYRLKQVLKLRKVSQWLLILTQLLQLSVRVTTNTVH